MITIRQRYSSRGHFTSCKICRVFEGYGHGRLHTLGQTCFGRHCLRWLSLCAEDDNKDGAGLASTITIISYDTQGSRRIINMM